MKPGRMGILALLALLLVSLLPGCSDAPDKRPNIILITVDTLRWDYLSPYGFEDAEHTPAANRLAANGTVFENAVSTAGTTIPSHASILTGQYARVHGARSNFHHKYPDVPTVTSALRDSGYLTGAFLSNQFLFNIAGLGEGFEVTNYPTINVPGEKHPYQGDKPVAQAGEWLMGADANSPVFLWVHLWEPHGPYDLTDWSRQRLGNYTGSLSQGVSLEEIHNNVKGILDSPQDLAAMRTIYAGEVRLADQYVGALLDELERSGRLDNSIVVLTADHGQSLGERRRMGHGPVHRETVLRVPLIIADFRHPKAARMKARVGTIDIATTISDLAGFQIPFPQQGQSLVSLKEIDREKPYFGEVAIRVNTDANWEKVKHNRSYDINALAVYSDKLKMVYRHGEYQMYSTGKNRKVASKIDTGEEPIMADYLQGLIETFQSTKIDLDEDTLSPSELEALQGLGYTQ